MKDKPHDLSTVPEQQWQHFGALLRDRGNAAKLSRLELALRAKLSDATIKLIESARHPPSRSTLIRLLSVAELHLTWAQVPGNHEPPAETPSAQALPPQSVPEEPQPDPAQFLMDRIGSDEIRLPPGTPKSLRIFRERPRAGEPDDGSSPEREHENERVAMTVFLITARGCHFQIARSEADV